jgi:hypothetical protein
MMSIRNRITAVAVALLVASAAGAQESKLTIGGTTYTKWLWGNQRQQGALYNYTTVPGEGRGDNGQGTEVELLLSARLSKEVSVAGRIHSRFNQNFWTNFGGFGGADNPAGQCQEGDCGENDPRSNQYVKLRGMTVTLTPGYKWIDSATIGANDFGQFDPFVIGRFRYIDRDNASGILLQGSANGRKFTWDATRISLPRLFAGPGFGTGEFHAADATYGLQAKLTPSSKFDVGFIGQYTNDVEIDQSDRNWDDGRSLRTRFHNEVIGVKAGFHPSSDMDFRAAIYHSSGDSDPALGAPGGFGISGFSPFPAGEISDEAIKLNADFNNLFDGFSLNVEYFDIGAQYASILASRREADVLITEGSDGAFYFPGPSNGSFGVFSRSDGQPRRSQLYGGWGGNAQQVPTVNVDNDFTDFDEPMAETVIGWKGITLVPTYSSGNLDLSGEVSKIDYNTNWQAWDDTSRAIDNSQYPNFDSDAGVFGSYRNAYAPFQEKDTTIALIKAKYLVDKGNGIEIFGKIKRIDETDDRMTSARFLPYTAGDCPGGSTACAGNANNYAGNFSTSAIYFNPPVITVNGVTGYQWKPFDSVKDDDKDLSYMMYQVGAGTQLNDDLYASLTYEYYDVSLADGNTAFQAYQLHEMASGDSTKNKVILKAKYVLAGAEIGFEYQYDFGTFKPDFGGGYVVQYADQGIQDNFGFAVGTPGFRGRYGGWNSLLERDFNQQALKAYMKVQF